MISTLQLGEQGYLGKGQAIFPERGLCVYSGVSGCILNNWPGLFIGAQPQRITQESPISKANTGNCCSYSTL